MSYNTYNLTELINLYDGTEFVSDIPKAEDLNDDKDTSFFVKDEVVKYITDVCVDTFGIDVDHMLMMCIDWEEYANQIIDSDWESIELDDNIYYYRH